MTGDHRMGMLNILGMELVIPKKMCTIECTNKFWEFTVLRLGGCIATAGVIVGNGITVDC